MMQLELRIDEDQDKSRHLVFLDKTKQHPPIEFAFRASINGEFVSLNLTTGVLNERIMLTVEPLPYFIRDAEALVNRQGMPHKFDSHFVSRAAGPSPWDVFMLDADTKQKGFCLLGVQRVGPIIRVTCVEAQRVLDGFRVAQGLASRAARLHAQSKAGT